MIEIRKILCPVDFSDFSRSAVHHAMGLASRYGSTVTLLYVCPGMPAIAYAAGTPPIEPTVLTADDRVRLGADLHRFAGIAPDSSVRVDAVVREGDVVQEVLAQAASQEADLLAVGTHGRSGFERLFLGSVTEKLLRKSSCPVLTVPLHEHPSGPGGPGAYKRILCPVDFSECSTEALQYAMSLAQENDAQLLVLYVVESDLVPLPGQSPGDGLDRTISVADFFIKREAHVRQLLENAVPAAVRTYCAVETAMAHGKPATEILRMARDRESDLIVMGVRGRGAVDRAVFGSTTQQVLRNEPCPVLTIRRG